MNSWVLGTEAVERLFSIQADGELFWNWPHAFSRKNLREFSLQIVVGENLYCITWINGEVHRRRDKLRRKEKVRCPNSPQHHPHTAWNVTVGSRNSEWWERMSGSLYKHFKWKVSILLFITFSHSTFSLRAERILRAEVSWKQRESSMWGGFM